VANIADQDSHHDVYTLAAALVCARTGQHCAKARQGVLDAIGTEHNSGGAWLEVGRNLGAYIIAADVLGLRADSDPNSTGSQVEAWLRGWPTKLLPDTHGNLRPFHEQAFSSGSNASAQTGFAYAALGVYLQDRTVITRAWDLFRRFAGDPTAPDPRGINLSQGIEYNWAHDDANAVAINPKGTTKEVPAGLPGAGLVKRIDGALINDMRRGGVYQSPPGYTQYPWTNTDGLVPAALVLHRAGYPAFEVADRAMLRVMEYQWWLRQETGDTNWFDGTRGKSQIHIINWYYGTSFLLVGATGNGRCVGYADWTHPIR
jgi:hypothetical protein